MGPDRADAWPLIGRASAVETALSAVDTRCGVAVIGPAGVGKSRVLGAVLADLRAGGHVVVEISGAESAAAIPLAPLLRLIDLDGAGHLGQRVLVELTRRSRHGPLVLAVDDAQNLDDASAALVHQVASSGLARVVVAIRTGELPPVAVTALWKDELLDTLMLDALDRAASTALVEAVVGRVGRHTQSWLWDRSHGHPLYLRELIRAVGEAGGFDVVDGVSHLPAGVDIPPSLIELIGQSLRDLGDDGVQALVAVALAQPVPFAGLVRLVGAAGVRHLCDRELVHEHDGELRTAHPLYGEVAVGMLGLDAQNDVRARLGGLLHGVPGREADAATLLLDAGGDPGADLLLVASEEASRLRQGALTVRLADELTRRAPTARAFRLLGSGHAISGDWERAEEAYRRAVGLADGDADADDVWLGWIDSTFEYRPDIALARDLASEATSVLTGGGRQIAQAWLLKARMLSEPMRVVSAAFEELATSRQCDSTARRMAELDLAACCWHLCEPHRGLALFEAGLAFDDDDPVYRSRGMQVHNALTTWGKGFEVARTGLETLETMAVETRHPDIALHAQAARILLHSRAGRFATVVEPVPEIDSLTAGVTVSRWVSLFMAEMSWAQCHLVGRLDAAASTLELAAQVDEHVSAPLIELVRSRLVDDVEAAAEHIERSVRLARCDDLAVYELLALREACARLGPSDERVHRIGELASLAGPGLAAIFADEARARLERDPARLERVAVDAERFGAVGVAWEIAAVAASVAREQGLFSDAFRAECRTALLGRSLPGQTSPVVEAIDPVLTAREVDVVEGLVDGLTNREIADRLFLSPKTIKSHLERIYRRLDVSSRGDVVALVVGGSAGIARRLDG